MKKLALLLALAITLLSCDKSEPIPTTNNTPIIEVSVISTTANYTSGGRYDFTSVIKNNTNTAQYGSVKISCASGNATVYTYIDNVAVNANQTTTVNQVSNVIFSGQPVIVSAEFIK